MVGLREQTLGNQPILFDQPFRHVQLTAIPNRRDGQERHDPVVQRLFREIDRVLKVVVGLLEFIVEEQVRLGELEGVV